MATFNSVSALMDFGDDALEHLNEICNAELANEFDIRYKSIFDNVRQRVLPLSHKELTDINLQCSRLKDLKDLVLSFQSKFLDDLVGEEKFTHSIVDLIDSPARYCMQLKKETAAALEPHIMVPHHHFKILKSLQEKNKFACKNFSYI